MARTMLALKTVLAAHDKVGTLVFDEIDANVGGEVARAEAKLGNEGFVAKAPQRVIDEERQKLEAAKDMKAKLAARLSELEK